MKNWNKWILLVIALLAFGFPGMPARAASAPTVMVEPVEVTTTVGTEIEIQILVIGGVDVNAYDLTLIYDPDILTLESWKHGDYLSNHWVVQNIDEPGRFQIADAQLGLPPVSGDGTLLELTFTTQDEGESNLTLEETTLADAGGNKSTPVTEDGSVIVAKSEGPSPTSMPTNTPTRTPTPTKTPASGAQVPTAKPTSTRTPTADDQNGAVELPGEGYPFEETEAMTAPTDVGVYPLGAEDEALSTGIPDDTTLEEAEAGDGTTKGEEPSGGESRTAGEPLEGLDILLWVVLVGAVLALVVMVIIMIRRRRNKPEDLLL
jgi:hypothetical protein